MYGTVEAPLALRGKRVKALCVYYLHVVVVNPRLVNCVVCPVGHHTRPGDRKSVKMHLRQT